MAAENLSLWERVKTTDPRHVKAITGKQYQGNSPKPHYIVYRLTEEFGPIGAGWGFTILDEKFEKLTETVTVHFARVRLWYERSGDPTRHHIEQMGGTTAVYTTNAGKVQVDEDAPKKSVTDALIKCASYLGFAADIFMGLWNDSNYVQHAMDVVTGREKTEESEQLRAKACAILSPAATEGLAAYKLAWGSISNDMRKAAQKDHEGFKKVAEESDKAVALAAQ